MRLFLLSAGLQDHAFASVFEYRHVEVDQQAEVRIALRLSALCG